MSARQQSKRARFAACQRGARLTAIDWSKVGRPVVRAEVTGLTYGLNDGGRSLEHARCVLYAFGRIKPK